MKKLMSVVLALALVCLSAALAEAIEPDQDLIDRFEDVWVDGDAAVEIWYDDGTFHCSAVLGDEDESSVWEFETCTYDAEDDALIFEGGERYSQTYVDDDLVSELAAQDLRGKGSRRVIVTRQKQSDNDCCAPARPWENWPVQQRPSEAQTFSLARL